MVAPEVLVVVELSFRGARVLPAKHPHLAAGLRGHHSLVGTPGRRSPWGYHLIKKSLDYIKKSLQFKHAINLGPLFPLDLIEEKLVVDEGLLAVVKLPAEHDELAVLCKYIMFCLLDLEYRFCQRTVTLRTFLSMLRLKRVVSKRMYSRHQIL